MDDPELYGEHLFVLELMEACERDLLASWEIDVLEIRDPDLPGPGASAEEIKGRRLAALQAALLKHHEETGTRSYLPFHSRTLDAMAFARAMPETAAELHQMDPALYPARVGADWLSGEHPADHRRQVLNRFADGTDEEGFVNDVQFLSSCQVLGEGVDIRGRRGVDAVVFADTRSSPVQIVQILGRALRQEPGEGKVARIVVPIFLDPGEDPDNMMASPSYRPLVAVLQGLRAHDERVIQRLLLSTSTARGQATSVIALDPTAPAEDDEDDQAQQEDSAGEAAGRTAPVEGGDTADAPAADENGETPGSSGQTASPRPAAREHAGVPLLRFSLPRNPDVIARFLRTRVLRPDSEVWLTGLNALRRWVEKHGDADVPLHATIDLGDGDEPYPLGLWVSEQRRAFRAGTLKPWRFELLNELGMIWSVADARFERTLTLARTCFERYGTLCVPRDTVIDGEPFGQTMANLRKKNGLGTKPDIAERRAAALCAIDPHWNPPWRADWQFFYTALAQLVGEEKNPEIPPSGVMVNGVDVGPWTQNQLDTWANLAEEQRALLTALGMAPAARPDATPGSAAGAPLVAGLAGMTAFERGMAALAQFKEREGHLGVPRWHIETLHADPAEADAPGRTATVTVTVTVKAGVFLSNTKARRAKLLPQQRAALAELGFEWAT